MRFSKMSAFAPSYTTGCGLWAAPNQGHSHTKVCQLQQDTALIWKNLNINLYTEWIVYIWFGHVASSTQWNSPETELLSNLGYIYHCLLAIRVIESCENLMKLIYFPFNFCIHSFTTSSITHSIFSSAYLHWNFIKIRLFLVVLINLVSTCVMGVWCLHHLTYDLILMTWPGKISELAYSTYHQTSNIKLALIGVKIVDHSDAVGASPVGAAPTTFST